MSAAIFVFATPMKFSIFEVWAFLAFWIFHYSYLKKVWLLATICQNLCW